MRDYIETFDEEMKVRGQIITLNLRLEDLITKILYRTFKPNNTNDTVTSLFLKEFILPMQYGKKVDLLKKVAQSDYYVDKIDSYLKTPTNILSKKGVHSIEDFTRFLNKSLTSILKYRNMVAHGINITELAANGIKVANTDLIFANKFKFERLSDNLLKKVSEEILTLEWILNMIEKF